MKFARNDIKNLHNESNLLTEVVLYLPYLIIFVVPIFIDRTPNITIFDFVYFLFPSLFFFLYPIYYFLTEKKTNLQEKNEQNIFVSYEFKTNLSLFFIYIIISGIFLIQIYFVRSIMTPLPKYTFIHYLFSIVCLSINTLYSGIFTPTFQFKKLFLPFILFYLLTFALTLAFLVKLILPWRGLIIFAKSNMNDIMYLFPKCYLSVN